MVIFSRYYVHPGNNALDHRRCYVLRSLKAFRKRRPCWPMYNTNSNLRVQLTIIAFIPVAVRTYMHTAWYQLTDSLRTISRRIPLMNWTVFPNRYFTVQITQGLEQEPGRPWTGNLQLTVADLIMKGILKPHRDYLHFTMNTRNEPEHPSIIGQTGTHTQFRTSPRFTGTPFQIMTGHQHITISLRMPILRSDVQFHVSIDTQCTMWERIEDRNTLMMRFAETQMAPLDLRLGHLRYLFLRRGLLRGRAHLSLFMHRKHGLPGMHPYKIPHASLTVYQLLSHYSFDTDTHWLEFRIRFHNA